MPERSKSLLSRSKALVVRRGSPPAASVITAPQQKPTECEVLVHLQAAALTPTDVLFCQGPPPPLGELLAIAPGSSVVPGFYFFGEVHMVGSSVEGLEVGEPVVGVLDGPALGEEGADAASGGCFQEVVRVHFSVLLPAAELIAAGMHMASVVAHLPPMVSALFCMSAHLRLRAGEALLILAPRLGDVMFLLQRLLLISDAWSGPLYLILLQGHAPTRADLERHPLLKPLLGASGREDEGGSSPNGFLEDFLSWSVEDHLPQSGASQPEKEAEVLRDLVGRAAELTRGMGFDAVLALDVELAPPPQPMDMAGMPLVSDAAEAPSTALLDLPPRPAMLLRVLLGHLAYRGRLVSNSRKLEMMPADSEHLWLKEGTLSFFNPHGLLLSGARHGALLHAMAEVSRRIARSELSVADAEVAQYRLFEQFHPAFEAVAGRGPRGVAGSATQLVALIV